MGAILPILTAENFSMHTDRIMKCLLLQTLTVFVVIDYA